MALEQEKIMRLYVPNENGACLEILPDPDTPDFGIMLHTPDEVSKKWFGDIRMTFMPEDAKELGKVLLDYATEFEKDQQE